MGGRNEVQAIAFLLNNEVYGIEVQQIKEIIKVKDYVTVPNAPNYIEGVINLRGQITPIVSLRKIFGMDKRPLDENSRIIMVELESEVIGLIVDSVLGVISAACNDVVKPPLLTSNDGNSFLTGIIRQGDQLIILIDVMKLMNDVKNRGSQKSMEV
ncbi:MAG: chemotaxis protein CheW [Candidatus Methanomethyliaceae archaeon]|nr:chemotaxis protein CheW [Candidatus Methanomethyliaceae archaeon]MDW7971302.1 chemotaxis protein CheW [Nitrososphaerota archaeon]